MHSYNTLTLPKQKTAKIGLIFIGQAHKHPNAINNMNYEANDFNCQSVVYSQLNIMKTVVNYSNAIVVPEGSIKDVTSTDLKPYVTSVFKSTFPEKEKIQGLDFNHLTSDQCQFLWNNLGVQILFHLKWIPCIYQSSDAKINLTEATKKRQLYYHDKLTEFPNLWLRSREEKEIPLEHKISPNEELEFKEFMELVVQNNPALYQEREKVVLNFVLRAAEMSGKEQAILIMGRDHFTGIKNLIENEYSNRFYLARSIDSLEGFLFPARRKQLKALSTRAIIAYKKSDYHTAIHDFERVITFWEAVPKSTPEKQASLLSLKFNLGSALLKMAAKDKEKTNKISYKAAADTLKQAVDLHGKETRNKKSSKYRDRYLQALIFSSFNRESVPELSVQLIMEYANIKSTF